jgi:hypothetical protein
VFHLGVGSSYQRIFVERIDEFSLDDMAQKSVAKPQEGKPAPKAVPKAETEKRLWLNVTDMDEADQEELMETLTFYAGDTTVIFVRNGKKMACSQKVTPNKALISELYAFLPADCIKLL